MPTDRDWADLRIAVVGMRERARYLSSVTFHHMESALLQGRSEALGEVLEVMRRAESTAIEGEDDAD